MYFDRFRFHAKIWLPISEEQMAINKNLTQNAQW